jgi:hypothetical protein
MASPGEALLRLTRETSLPTCPRSHSPRSRGLVGIPDSEMIHIAPLHRKSPRACAERGRREGVTADTADRFGLRLAAAMTSQCERPPIFRLFQNELGARCGKSYCFAWAGRSVCNDFDRHWPCGLRIVATPMVVRYNRLSPRPSINPPSIERVEEIVRCRFTRSVSTRSLRLWTTSG